jgi:hypothetical protein
VAGRAGSYQTLTPAPRAEYVNETAFLTGSDALGELRINVTRRLRRTPSSSPPMACASRSWTT